MKGAGVLYHLGGNTYAVVTDHKNGWNYEVFRERYSEVLDRYDYIVGDWGYNQLRLKGFFKEANNKGSKEASIALLHDYLNEYCNFGCAYFIIEKLASRKVLTEGEDAEMEAEARAYEAEKLKDPDFKPRQHYHRNNEQRHKAPAEKGTISAAGAPAEGKPRGQENGRSGGDQHRSKGQDNRPRGQDQGRGGRDQDNGRVREQDGSRGKDHDHSRQRDNENGRSRGEHQEQRHREHSGRQKEQQEHKGKPHSGSHQQEKNKGQHPQKNKPHDHHRMRDKERDKSRDRDKEKAEPLA
jgi:uncharacterized protein YutD